MTPSRSLTVFCNDTEVGCLSEAGAVWRFSYSESWRRAPSAFDLSPALPRRQGEIADGASQRPVQWFFDNLLPEEGARQLVAQQARIDVADAFGLLTYYGAESAGALMLLPPDAAPGPGALQPLPEAELSARIRQLPRVALSAHSPKRMSLAGAQHKIAVVLQGDALLEPVGATPSTHILKPDHTGLDAYPHTAANEWFCMRLAERLGLPVPAVQLRYVPEPVYLVQRFDRELEGGAVVRHHAIDGCQLLDLDRSYKYRMANLAALQQILEQVRSRAQTRQRLYRWLVFNLLIGNHDAHLKNLSFLQAPAGSELAPHYDLLSTAVYVPDQRWGADLLPWPIGSAARLDEVTPADVIALGQGLGLSERIARRQLEQMIAQIPAAADAVLADFAELATPAEAGVGRAGEARLLRTIRHGVIPDMCRRLTPQ